MIFRCRAALLLLVLCLGALRAEAERLRVMATFAPLYCFAVNVAGDAADVTCLLPPNAGPHEYALRPGDARRIAEADVIVMNGLGLEDAYEAALASNPRAVRIRASAGIRQLPGSREIVIEDGSAECAHGHDHDHGMNPHVWLDPVLAKRQVLVIAEGLAKADAANAEGYRARGRAYAAQLEALHGEWREAMASVANRRFVALHDAFPYLARRYGLEQAGVVSEFPGREPTPRYLASLIETIRRERVAAVLGEPGSSPALVRRIAADTGARTALLDSMETGEWSASFYTTVSRRNLAVLREALK
jgi:zinc/manganese transport system substrate-binding protein